MWGFLIVSTLAWGIAEIFYKKGSLEKEKYSHLKITAFVGLFMGLYATVILFTQGVNLKYFPLNFLYYLPVAACYIISMVCSYFGVRFIQESISDPIENTSGAVVPVLCAIFMREYFEDFDKREIVGIVIGIAIVFIGLLCVGFLDKKGKEERHFKYGKKLAVWAIAMPFCYMILDAVGTFLDIFYTNDVASSVLVHVTDANLEHTANCAYEFTFLLVAIGILIFLKVKKVRLFETPELVTTEGVQVKWYEKVLAQKWKILAAIFETIGQATYLFALSEGGGIAAVILGAGTVITSLILSRIFLKEKLTLIQYLFIAIIMGGIIMLALLGV